MTKTCCEQTVGELLESMNTDRGQLEESLSHLFEELFGSTLNYMEVALPFATGQASENELKFKLIRSKVLGEGNEKIRAMRKLLKHYLIKKVSQPGEEVRITFPGRGKV